MVLSGICATPHADLQGYVLLAGAVDTAQRPPLFIEHQRAIGELTALMYIGSELHLTAEVTDGTDVNGLDFFSICGKPLQREQRGNLYHVSKFRIDEVSVVKVPANDRCHVLSRKPSDPVRKFITARNLETDLFIAAFGALARGLRAINGVAVR